MVENKTEETSLQRDCVVDRIHIWGILQRHFWGRAGREISLVEWTQVKSMLLLEDLLVMPSRPHDLVNSV